MESLLLRKKNRNKMFDRETLPCRLHRVRCLQVVNYWSDIKSIQQGLKFYRLYLIIKQFDFADLAPFSELLFCFINYCTNTG